MDTTEIKKYKFPKDCDCCVPPKVLKDRFTVLHHSKMKARIADVTTNAELEKERATKRLKAEQDAEADALIDQQH